jgi:hypothetical protein
MTYRVSEEGPVYQSDLLSVARPTAVVMGWRKEAQAPGVADVVNREAGVGVLRNNGWAMPEKREVW